MDKVDEILSKISLEEFIEREIKKRVIEKFPLDCKIDDYKQGWKLAQRRFDNKYDLNQDKLCCKLEFVKDNKQMSKVIKEFKRKNLENKKKIIKDKYGLESDDYDELWNMVRKMFEKKCFDDLLL